VLVTLTPDDFVVVSGVDADWFILDLNVGTVHMDAIGYIQRGIIGGLKGPCDGL
jgi:hypothetical protein